MEPSMKATISLAMALATALALPAGAWAAADPAKVEAGSYAVEPNHTRILFSVDHMGFTNYFGDFTGATGTLQLKNPGPAGSSLAVSIPVASISTTNAILDGELKAADWFDAAKFPTIGFKSTAVKQTGADTAEVTGDLTMHGVTKAVTLKARLHGFGQNPMSKKTTVGFDVTGKIKRSDWGVTKYVGVLGDDVDITISAAFEKQG
jgi:polyisoprenoid-binding protein YceI